MMLTTKSRYAVMALLEVAASGSLKPMKLSDISNNQTIPLNYLEQIFLKLKKANLVTSIKGPGGGYRLNNNWEKLNIIDIIDAVEENTKMTRCSVDKTCRKNGVKCMTHELWKGLGNHIRNYFASISIKDVMLGNIDLNSEPSILASSLVITDTMQEVAWLKNLYLDHNSTTELLTEVKKTMVETFEKPLNASAIHAYGREGRKIIEKSRRQIAQLVGINNNFSDYNITFTSSGTEANNLILSNFKDNDIFISTIEHSSIFAHSKLQSNVHLISVDNEGILNKEDLTQHLMNSKSEIKLVSVMLANNETGVIQPIKEIARIAREYGALIHSDCVQALGKIEVDLIDFDLDFATISAHKIGGPLGAGALISKLKYHLMPQIIGGGQEKNIRSGTENIPAIAGFGTAAEIGNKEQKLRYKNLISLRNYLEEKITNSFPQVRIISQNSPRLPNTSLIINVGKNAEIQIIAFDLKNIAISSGSACSSGKIGESSTLTAMKFTEEEKKSALRISLGFATTKEDIDKFLEIYKEINCI